MKQDATCWWNIHDKVNEAADSFFYSLGYWVATHTKLTLFISLLSVIVCCFGFANFELETDGEYWLIMGVSYTAT